MLNIEKWIVYYLKIKCTLGKDWLGYFIQWWWTTYGQNYLDEMLDLAVQTSGPKISLDTTYKIGKGVGAYLNAKGGKKWVSIYFSGLLC